MARRSLLSNMAALALFAASSSAGAQSYSFRYTDTSGAVIGAGVLTVDGGTYDASTFAGPGATGTAVVAVTGSFEGQALSYIAAPNPSQPATDGVFAFGDDLLLSGPVMLDEGGLLLGTTGPLGRGNLLGFPDPQAAAVEGAPYLWTFQGQAGGGYHGYLTFVTMSGATVSTPGGALAAPTALPAGAVGAITGSIGPDAPERFYSFVWAGGAFAATASVTGAAGSDAFDLALMGSGVDVSSRLSAAGGFIDALDMTDLAAGTYVIGLSADAGADAAFALQFDTAVGSAVPEASTWAMLLVGFGAGGSALRRRRKVAPMAAAWAG